MLVYFLLVCRIFLRVLGFIKVVGLRTPITIPTSSDGVMDMTHNRPKPMTHKAKDLPDLYCNANKQTKTSIELIICIN